MRNCLAWPVSLADGRAWVAGELQDHQLMLSCPGEVWFIYDVRGGIRGLRALAAALAAAEGKYGQMRWAACRTSVEGLTRIFSGAFERTEDRWLVPATAWRDRLHAISSGKEPWRPAG